MRIVHFNLLAIMGLGPNAEILKLMEAWGKHRLLVVIGLLAARMLTRVDSLCLVYSMVEISLFVDSAYIVQSDGGTPYLGNDTVSNNSKTYRFKHLTASAASQWIDVEQSNFVNWFTIPTTSTKYMLMGKLNNMTSGDYRLIIKNSYPTNG